MQLLENIIAAVNPDAASEGGGKEPNQEYGC